MAAVPPSATRRRPRPGSLDRPVNGRLYRGTWLLVGLPLLILAFSVARPHALPPPDVAPAFDAADAAAVAQDLTTKWPARVPDTPGAHAAAGWFRDQIAPYGLTPSSERFVATVPRLGRLQLENLVVRIPGRVPSAIVVLAHRDNGGPNSGANDNASGTAALVELARTYSRLRPTHTILFVSTDGGAFGGLGAAQFVAHSPERHEVVAAINLDAIGGAARPRLIVGGDTPRTTSATLLETTAARIAAQTGRGPSRPSVLRQLVDLGFPFDVYEQAPFVSREIPAVTITTAGDRPPSGLAAAHAPLSETRIGQVGRSAEDLLGTLDQGLEFAQGTSSYVYVGSRIIRGWAIELVLIAAVLPFLAAAIDLFARSRRRHIALAPALRSYRSRLGFWIWVALLFELFTLLGAWPDGSARPPSLTSTAAHDWPAAPLLGLGVLAALGWLVARDRLIPRRPVSPAEVLAGHTAAMLCLAVVALLVVATNPFALIFVLPSLHAWLWLPNIAPERRWTRAGVVATGYLGPALIVGSFAFRYGLGWDAPWYILELRALGYVPFAVVLVTVPWLAAAGQVAALAAGRYAPYPDASERPRLGPGRRALRRVVLGLRHRRAASRERPAAAGGG
jgi:peptidase M28-like protein